MSYVFINIGSNLGNRRLNLTKAVRAIEEEFGYFEASHAVETAPWGYESDNPYLNMGLSFQTDLLPHDLLRKLQEIERKLSPTPHRDENGNYTDRIIDIDIVAIDRDVIDDVDLKVPHPHLPERRFFLAPLAELAPAWTHPVSGLTPAEMLESLPPEPEITKKEE